LSSLRSFSWTKYRFDGTAAGETAKHFVVSADLALFEQYRVGFASRTRSPSSGLVHPIVPDSIMRRIRKPRMMDSVLGGLHHEYRLVKEAA
jgi:hypothetical protein